jgi:hypothetical protein
MEWWRRTNELPLGLIKKGLNSLVILGAWTLWKHQNHCVFDATAPNLAAAIAQTEERRVWVLARAKEITSLMAQLLDVQRN